MIDEASLSPDSLAATELIAEHELVPISALQHFLFCPRQCALIHVERLWAENIATIEGRLLHEAVDGGKSESRPGVRIARGVQLCSRALGLSGRADVVEFRGDPPLAFPVEYKRGKPKAHRADEVQLCAQALCLEEMLGRGVPEGALFYGENRRRHPVTFDDELRRLTAEVAQSARAMFAERRTPAARFTPACRKCSMEPLCKPRRLESPPKVGRWLSARLEGALENEA